MAGRDVHDPRNLQDEISMAGLDQVGGVASLMGFQTLFPSHESQKWRGMNTWDEASRLIWPIRMAAEWADFIPTKAERNPKLKQTDGEKWAENLLGVRTLRKGHDVRMQRYYYQQLRADLMRRLRATKDPEDKELIKENLKTLRLAVRKMREASK